MVFLLFFLSFGLSCQKNVLVDEYIKNSYILPGKNQKPLEYQGRKTISINCKLYDSVKVGDKFDTEVKQVFPLFNSKGRFTQKEYKVIKKLP